MDEKADGKCDARIDVRIDVRIDAGRCGSAPKWITRANARKIQWVDFGGKRWSESIKKRPGIDYDVGSITSAEAEK